MLTPEFALLPLVVTNFLMEGPLHLGLIEAAVGIGVVAVGILLDFLGGFSERIMTTLVGLVPMGVFITIFGLTPGIDVCFGGGLDFPGWHDESYC